MNPIKKILILLILLCVIGSAAAVSAEDYGSDGGYAGSNYNDMNGVSGSQDTPDYGDHGTDGSAVPEGDTVPDGNPEIIPPDWNHDEHAAGEPTNETGNSTNTTGTDVPDAHPQSEAIPAHISLNETGNSTNATANNSHTMLATGNPILVLIAVGAVLGSAAVIKRK